MPVGMFVWRAAWRLKRGSLAMFRRFRRCRLTIAGMAVLLVLAGLGAWLLPVQIMHALRSQASLIVKHAPLCMLENRGLVAPRRAHFTEAGTVDILYCTPARAPVYEGKPFPDGLVVVSDFGRVVQRFAPGGALLWQRVLHLPRGLEIANGEVLVGDERDLVVLDLATGSERRRFHLARFILGIRLHGKQLLLTHDEDGARSVAAYRISGQNLLPVQAYGEPFAYPRALDTKGGRLIVADTVGHRVAAIDAASGRLAGQAASYFPNSVQIDGDDVIVAEEHLNLVTVFSLDTLAPAAVLAGCAAPVLEQRSLARPAPPCSQVAPRSQLFSPNDAVRAAPFLYVADTDKHRLLVFNQGHYWGALSGFNNPVNVRLVPAAPP